MLLIPLLIFTPGDYTYEERRKGRNYVWLHGFPDVLKIKFILKIIRAVGEENYLIIIVAEKSLFYNQDRLNSNVF